MPFSDEDKEELREYAHYLWNEQHDDSVGNMYEAGLTMLEESDRGCLLVGLANVEDSLQELLTAALTIHGTEKDALWLLDPKPGNRPLATLAVRTRMARCLGLIDKDVQNVLNALRTLRNEHAHGFTQFVLTDDDMTPVMNAWSSGKRAEILSTLKLAVESPESPELELWNKLSDSRKHLTLTIIWLCIQIDFEGISRVNNWRLEKDALTAVPKRFRRKPLEGKVDEDQKKTPPNTEG